MTPIATRMVRLLNMVPYFQANPRITRAEAAAKLGVSAKQLEEDLNQQSARGRRPDRKSVV